MTNNHGIDRMQFNDYKKTLLIATLIYSVTFACCLINLLHIAHLASNKPLLPFMPVSIGVNAVLFNGTFIALHFLLGLLTALPIWLPLLIGSKKEKVVVIVNWLCMLMLLTIVPLNNYLVAGFATGGEFNSAFFLLFSFMMGVTIFACVVIYQREKRRRI